MTIPFDIELIKNRGETRLDAPLLNNGKEWMAWWYSGIVKNRRANTQPYIKVAFRQLVNAELSDKVYYQDILVTALGQVRVGSVWKNGVCIKQAQFDSQLFNIDFTYKAWTTNSFEFSTKNSIQQPFNQDIYPLQWPFDKNWMLEFPLPTGGKLVVPCLEYFARCYGSSGELKRIIMTYPWDGVRDTAKSRLYAPLSEGEIDDGSVWKIKLRQRLYNGDVVLLAHAKYDKTYTHKIIKKIYAQIESQYDARKPNKLVFIKVAPWFQGDAALLVKGLWFNNNKSFLALNITGGSEPAGLLIERDRTNTNKTNKPADPADAGKAWNGAPDRILIPPQIVDLTGNTEPDHGAPVIEIHDPDYIILGKPRKIKDIKRDKAQSSKGSLTNGDDATVFATGDPFGSNKGVGYASIHAKTELESIGALRDMWNAVLYLQKKHPKRIISVEWFTHSEGYQSDSEPKLIALNPFPQKIATTLNGDVRNWPYYDVKTKQLRGVLLIRITLDGQFIYIFEIQRRPRIIANEDGIKLNAEEAYTGLVFQVAEEQQADDVIQYFTSRIRYVKGIVKNLLRDCPASNAEAFQHRPSVSENIACESALMNAINKMDVKL